MTNDGSLIIVEGDAESRTLLAGFLRSEGFDANRVDGGAALDRRLARASRPTSSSSTG